MIQRIGPIRYAGQSLARGSSGVVQDQLAQVESQLAACLNCATANTAAGRTRIQLLSARVQMLKSRVEELQKGQRNLDQGATGTPANTELPNDSGSTQVDAMGLTQGGALGGSPGPFSTPLEGRLDLLA